MKSARTRTQAFGVFFIFLGASPLWAAPHPLNPPALPAVTLSGENKKNSLPGGDSFTYAFAQRPQLGTIVLKVKIIDGQGRPKTDLRVVGRYGMPSMRGAHDSGEKAFVLNKKGDYLLPVDVVMPGEWETHLFFYRGNRLIFHGVVLFEV